MAKMTRAKLKGIVKECLVEILSEGIGAADGATALREASENSRRQQQLAIKNEQQRLENHRKKLDRRIEDTVSSLTTNSVMQDILADTARTTLQEQMSHDSGQPGRPNVSDPGISLDNIFSESANNWAQLAFDDKKSS